jgi:hypothetical protein
MARKKDKEIQGVTLDAAELSAGASHRRVRLTTEAEYSPEWKCQYCGKVLANETYYMKHSCREKQRAEELATPIGQAAYMFYCDWMKAYKRKAPSADTFATSRYYATFVEFAKHVKKLNIGNPSKFVEIMCQKDLSPMLWRRDQCYSMYLEWMDKSQDPLEQVKVSIETLIDIAEREEVKIFSDIFIHMGVRQISEQIRLRKLSPWFLFCSRKFSEYLKSLSKEESLELSAIINPAYWTTKLQENKNLVKEIMAINKEMGL